MDDEKRYKEILVSHKKLSEIGMKALELVGVPKVDAKITVDLLLCAELRGVGSHGIQRLLMYIPLLRKGLINPDPKISIETLAPSIKVVHGDNGLGPVIATRGMQDAIDLAKDTGVAFEGRYDYEMPRF